MIQDCQKIVHFQYCKDPNKINDVIINGDSNWDGLKSAVQIISISYDTNHGCYVVFWWDNISCNECKENSECLFVIQKRGDAE